MFDSILRRENICEETAETRFKVYVVNPSRIVAKTFMFLPDQRICNLRRQKVENRKDKQQILVHTTQHKK